MQFQLDGYKSGQTIYESQNSSVMLAWDLRNNRSVAIKWIASYLPPDVHSNLQTEFEISKMVESPWTIHVYELIKNSQGSFLVMEDFGAVSLKSFLNSKPMQLPHFISAALQMCDAINIIHTKNVIHKDINPSNFIIHPEKRNVKMIDFGISSLLKRSDQESITPDDLEGTLSYISPEQTGRMNCSIDYRTDFYSLGISFYEMLTAELPFYSPDPLSMIHYHIAGKPDCPLHELNKDVPEIFTIIINRLIAKNPENRYQNIIGLKSDLEKCQRQLEENGNISVFPVAEKDFSDKLLISRKLYGRQKEVNALLSAFETMHEKGGFYFVTVDGYSGVGKTSLIREIHKPVLARRGYFISGKYDQFLKNIPYSALIDSLKIFIEQILSLREEELKIWKTKIQDSLGNNGRVLFELLPELELILDKQPEISELDSIENQNRFQMVFCNFIRTIAARTNPIVIFLDDLQWADSATLSLIREIASVPDNLSLMIIGAYRENEVDDAHPLRLTLKSLWETNVPVTEISISPLEVDHICELLSDTLRLNIETVKPLAELLCKKTAGNPYFLGEFLKSLYTEKLLNFDNAADVWKWELSKIKERGFSDNAAEFMSRKVLDLGRESLSVIKTASVLGNQFDLNDLSLLLQMNLNNLLQHLLPCIEGDLLLSRVDIYKAAHRQETEIKEITFHFAHDRVQQAAYELLSEEERIQIHYKYGTQLLKKYAENLEERVFLIVDHLNYAIPIIKDREELEQLIYINLKAGKRARTNTAYQHALIYFQTAMELLNDSDKKTEFTYQLNYELAETAQLLGEYGMMEKSINLCIENSANLFEKVKAVKIRLVSLVSRNLLEEATVIGLELLKLLKINTWFNPTPLHILYSLFITRKKVSKFKKENFASLEQAKDNLTLEAMEILNIMLFVSYYTRPNLTPVLVLKGLRISIDEGYSRHSVLFILALPNILCHHLGKVEGVMDYIPVCLSLLAKIQDKSAQSMVYYYIKQFFLYMKFPLKEKMDYYEICFRLGQESGNFMVSSLSIINLYFMNLFLDEDLNSVKNRMSKYIPVIKQMNQVAQIHICLLCEECFVLLTDSKSGTDAPDAVDQYSNSIKYFKESKDTTALFFHSLMSTVLFVLFRDMNRSLQYTEFMHQKREAVVGQIYSPLSIFFTAIAYLGKYADSGSKQQRFYKKRIKQYQKRLLFYSTHCPENFLNKWQLVEAERYRVLNQDSEAIKFYQLAVDSAHRNGFLMEEGFANELAAEFWISRNNRYLAAFFVLAANKVYSSWGASAKVEQLRQKYDDILRAWNVKSAQTIHSSVTQFTAHGARLNYNLDLKTIIKATQTISAEIKIKNLLEKLLHIIIENAGADRSVMIMLNKNEMYIQAECTLAGNQFSYYEDMSVKDGSLPFQILDYVKHSRQTVILHDAEEEGQFRNDPYIIKNKINSVLCLPVLKQDILFAILYLENSMTKAAFTSERVEIINILSSQAALSMENSFLYSNLEENVLERTKELQEALTLVEKQHTELKEAQGQLIQSEKMATLGQLVANVAHEINTPIGAVKASGKNISYALEKALVNLPRLLRILEEQPRGLFTKLLLQKKENAEILSTREERSITKETTRLLEENNIQDARKKAEVLVQLNAYTDYMDYMPLLTHPESSFILDTANSIAAIINSTSNINTAVDKVSKIIFALKSFSHTTNTTEMMKANLKEGIEIVLTIYQNQLKQGIEIIRKYEEIPQVECFPDELNQVWTNLIHNAIQAMVGKGRLTISVRQTGSEVSVSIADTGSGIPESIRPRIFDPFFTTKPSGVGSGLGLDIAKKIIDRHKGRIEVHSEVGVGTEFSVCLPFKG